MIVQNLYFIYLGLLALADGYGYEFKEEKGLNDETTSTQTFTNSTQTFTTSTQTFTRLDLHEVTRHKPQANDISPRSDVQILKVDVNIVKETISEAERYVKVNQADDEYNNTYDYYNQTWIQLNLGGISFNICNIFEYCRSTSTSTFQGNINAHMFALGVGALNIDSFPIDTLHNNYEFSTLSNMMVNRKRKDVSAYEKLTRTEHHTESQRRKVRSPETQRKRAKRHGQTLDIINSLTGVEPLQVEIPRLQITNCYCDEYCLLYGDCCVDAFDNFFELYHKPDVFSLISDMKSRLHVKLQSRNLSQFSETDTTNINAKIHSFILDFSTCERVDEDVHMMLVSRCPTDFVDASLREKCENPISPLLPPVTFTLAGEHVTFKNAHCAQCHGIASSRLQMWSTHISCKNISSEAYSGKFTMTSLISYLKNDTCQAIFSMPLKVKSPRNCKPHLQMNNYIKHLVNKNAIEGQCSETDSLLCQTYEFPYNNFRNPHCQRCLDAVQPQLGYFEVTENCSWLQIYTTGIRSGGTVLILDITGKFSDVDTKKISYLCEDTEVFNALTLECKKLMCAPGQEPYKGKCIETNNRFIVTRSWQMFPEGWQNLHVLMNISIESNYISCGELNYALYHMLTALQAIVCINSKIEGNELHEGTCSEQIRSNTYEIEGYVNVTFHVERLVNIYMVQHLQEYATSFTEQTGNNKAYIMLTNMASETRSLELCSNYGSTVQRTDFRLVEYKDIAYALLNSTKTGIYYPLDSIGFEIIALSNTIDPVTFISRVYLCEPSKLLSRDNCSVVFYWLNETRFSGSGIEIVNSNHYYQEGDFDVWADRVFICSNFEWKVEVKTTEQSLTYFVLSCVLTCISVIFLLVMLFLYWLLPELRTLPGKMLASLAGTMMLSFLSNIFTFMELHHDYICPIAAVISHVVTLSHFGWMSAIAVNIAMTFGPNVNSRIRNVDSRKVFLRVNVVVWGLSVFLVMSSVALDLAHREDITELNVTHETISASPVLNTSKSPLSTMTSLSSPDPPKYPRYGYPHCTWFSGPLWARLSFIVIPYFITFIINVTAFIVTIIGIYRSSKILAKVGKKSSERSCYLIYIKLSAAMGFSWITSILTNIFPKSEILSCIYLCLVLLQGFLLFLAFMTNKRVYALLVQKLSAKMRGNLRSSRGNVCIRASTSIPVHISSGKFSSISFIVDTSQEENSNSNSTNFTADTPPENSDSRSSTSITVNK